MANTTLTHQMVAREAAKVFEEEAPFTMGINKGRQDEFGNDVNGYKQGDSVRIKVPSVNPVYDGAVYAGGGPGNINTEQFVTLQLNGRKHVALEFTAKEKALDITDFKERILRPQMQTLASVVEADLLSQAYRSVYNQVGTAGSVPTLMKTYAQARGKLQNFLAPGSNRSTIFSSDANTELVDTTRVLFNPSKTVEKQYLSGLVGSAQGSDFFEHQLVPTHTNGSKVAGVTVNGAGQTGSTLNIGGLNAADTIKAGSVFTMPLVTGVHPLTGVAYTTLQQFVVTADFTAVGANGTISISPPITIAAPNKTVAVSPAGGAGLTFTGAASTSYRQNLMFSKDAFTAAFAPLPVLASCEGYTARLPSGISVRVMTFGDGNNDIERTRVDVLYGFQTVRAPWACRITE